MGLTRRLTVACTCVALASGAALVHDALRWRAVAGYDAALAADHLADAAGLPGERGRYAKAYALHRAGDYQAARVIYSELEHSADPLLRRNAFYNAGNTYLEQAGAMDMKKDGDRALPLIELAKGSYRAALAQDSADWDARHNLQRALELSPDVPDRKLMELEGLRRTIRTHDTGDPEGDLP